MAETATLHGLVASFESAERLAAAAREARAAGFTRLDAYGPLPSEEVSAALGQRDLKVPFISLGCGIAAAVLTYGLQYYAAVVDLPIAVGGKPLHAWPPFLVLCFAVGVLSAVLGAVIGMLALNRFPEPWHPIFAARDFDRVSLDRHFLCIRADDGRFEAGEVRRFLEGLGALSVEEMAA